MRSKPKVGKRGLEYILKISMLALCLSAVLTVSGCATSVAMSEGQDFDGIMQAVKTDLFGAEEQDCRQISLVLPLREGFEPISDKYAYASLKDVSMQEAYKSLEESLFLISSEKNADGCYMMKHTIVPSELNSNEIYTVKEAVLSDHPEAFWLTGDYDIGHNLHDGNYITMYSKYSYDEIVEALKEVNVSTEQILMQIPDGADELTCELMIHDALVDMIVYDSDAAESVNYSGDAFNAYGALVDKKAVCSGYARAAKMLLNRVGIESRLVSGNSGGSGHMWNQVKINQQWYNLDITWNDSPAKDGIVYRRYNYFNITDQQLAADHELGKNFSELICEYTEENSYATVGLYNFDLEECTAVDANYYMMHAVYVTSTDAAGKKLITDKMKELSLTKGEMLYIRFDESISSQKANDWLSGKSHVLSGCMASANNFGKGARIDNCAFVPLGLSDKDVWKNVYAVRLVYV